MFGLTGKSMAIYGGIGAVVLVGGYMLLKNSAASTDTSGADSSSYYPATVYGGTPAATGSDVTSSTTDGTASTTDSSIQALIASTLTQAQNQLTATLDTNATQKAIALAGYQSSENVANINSNAAIEQSLASQLGAIAQTFVSSGSNSSSSSGFFGIGGGSSGSSYTKGVQGVNGTIGYTNGVISVNLNQAKAA